MELHILAVIGYRLGMFCLAFFGFLVNVLYKTYKADMVDPDVALSPWHVYMIGPARWKTISNVMVIALVALFFPIDFVDQIAHYLVPGVPTGLALWIVLGYLSESALSQAFSKLDKKLQA